MGGPPSDGRNQSANDQRRITNGVLTNPSMDRFLNFLDGTGVSCAFGAGYVSDQNALVAPPSMAPFLWGSDGVLQQRLPAGLAANTAALEALKCPYESGNAADNLGECAGETTASGDLSHLVFSSADFSFSEPGEPAGLTLAPGSAYDQDLATGKVSLISRLPAALGGGAIPQDPTFANAPRYTGNGTGKAGGPEEFIRFPAVSEDGSHVLMSTATTGSPLECGVGAGATTYPCERYVEEPLHLYMRIGGGEFGETYEIAEDSATHEPTPVTFVGMTPDGSKVFFTSEVHLTPENPEHGGAGLYMWSAAKAEAGEQPLTLISKGPSEAPGAPGNTADCHPVAAPLRGNSMSEQLGVLEGYNRLPLYKEARPWTSSCGIVSYAGYHYSWLTGGRGGSGFEGTSGGSGFTPAAIAANGDIYFYSPERLDGVHGENGQQNLFLYRNGQLQYVTTLAPERRCGPFTTVDWNFCSDGPIVRLQVTSDDSRMAFVTASRITPYDNAGHLEMYTYDPASGEIHCVSCNPNGQAATADVFASEDGLFLTDDGRVFFSTEESLIPRDTNDGIDVYEYVAGRPQLITPGTGVASPGSPGGNSRIAPGLIGVSADGTDVYFSTLDPLIPEDHNGNFLRFYDARTNGGFPRPAPAQPCAAAEECHGPGTEAPLLPTQATGASLSGGNFKAGKHHRKKRKQDKRKRRHRAAHHRGDRK
jgi:hypothetical protein